MNKSRTSQSISCFGWSYNKASIVFRATENWMLANHGHRLPNLDFWLPRFKGYNVALKKHLAQLSDIIPPEFANGAFWLDRASLRIGDVGKPWAWQQCF